MGCRLPRSAAMSGVRLQGRPGYRTRMGIACGFRDLDRICGVPRPRAACSRITRGPARTGLRARPRPRSRKRDVRTVWGCNWMPATAMTADEPRIAQAERFGLSAETQTSNSSGCRLFRQDPDRVAAGDPRGRLYVLCTAPLLAGAAVFLRSLVLCSRAYGGAALQPCDLGQLAHRNGVSLNSMMRRR